MGKLEKQLAKIPRKDRLEIERIIERIIGRDLVGLDVKKLKGLKNIFRVRKGNYRIIFESDKSKSNILAIERRSEYTYDF